MKGLQLIRDQALSFGLVVLLFLTLVWSIQAAAWSDGLSALTLIALSALAIGFLLGLSRWPALLVHSYSLVAGFIIMLLVFAAQLPADLSWAERSMNVIMRVQRWVSILINKQPNYDNLVFVIQLALYMWLFAHLSAWGLFRHRKVGFAVIPAGVGLLFNLYYAPPQLALYFLQYLLISLVLVIRLNFQRQQLAWAEARIGYATEVGFDFFRDGLVIALLALALAWTVPAVPNFNPLARVSDRLETRWRVVQDEFNRVFGSLRSYKQPEGELFNRTMLLGGPVNLTNTPIVDIEATRGHYWRATAYDFYGGRGWASTYEEMEVLGKDTLGLANPPYQLRQLLRQDVRVLIPTTRTIIAAPQLLDVDVATEAYLQSLPFEDEVKNRRPPADIAAAYAQVRLREGDVYQVYSSVSIADEESLRNAGDKYEDWIVPRYLELPTSMPDRVIDLARKVTDGLTNNYDRAQAIETYLRGFTYNDQIEAPPADRDAVDYFLFELQQGYCDYYASAFAVMARSVGIPARLARGYSQGTKEPDTDIFRVREKNGHAWPEVYFPNYGWIEFEPTASEPLIVRPTVAEAAPAALDEAGNPIPPDPELDERLNPPQSNAAAQGPQSTWLYNLVVDHGKTIGTLMLLAVALFVVTRLFWRVLEPRGLTGAQRAYLRMGRSARVLLGLAPEPAETTYEYSGALVAEVPAAETQIQTVARVYVREHFAPSVALTESDEALAAWRGLAPALLRRSVIRLVQRVVSRLQLQWLETQRFFDRRRME